MTEIQERDTEEAEPALVSAVVRVKGPDGAIGGAGFLIAPDLVLTCAHVVSDALERPREDTVEAGAEVTVDVPLARNADGVDGGDHGAEVQRWLPIRPDQTGDIAVLRLRNRIPGARPLPVIDPQRGVWDHDARAVGFTGDNPDGIWQSGRFRGPTRQGWIQLSRANGESVYVKGGFSGSPVWDNELGAAVGMMVAAQPVREAQQAFVLRTRTLLKEVPELAPYVSPASPFRGLSTFQEGDADVFFGRDDDIERVVTALRGDQPTVTVYGPSGCGKSSLALAGVVPRMRQDGYRILQVNATRFSSLRAALATELFEIVTSREYGPPRAQNADQVDRWLRELGLADAFHRVAGQPAARLLIVLDQAEALLNRSEPELAEAVELLVPQRQPTGLRVLVTLRADFMDGALSHAHLGPALKRGVTLPLTPMTRNQLHAVINEPLKRIPAVEYDPGLDRRILDDAGGEPGILPLLGFVLAQLWERRATGRLRAATYEDIGAVSGALRRHAEQAWRECVPPGSEAEARRLLTGLVRVLPGGEAPLRRALTREEAGEECWRLAQALAERRLLVLYGSDGRPETAELAHEALITAWPMLAELVRADADFLAVRAEVQHDLERWWRADGSADLLPGPLQLAAVEARLRGREADLTEEQREFLALAHRRRRAQRLRVRMGWVAVAVVLALFAGLGTFLVQESRVSAQREAEGRSRALAVQSDESTDVNPGQAALAALAAYEIAPTQEARSALMRRYEELRDAGWALTGAEGEARGAVMSADGRVTLVTTASGRATLFVRTAEGRVRQEPLRLPDNVLSPVVSRDGRRIAYVRDVDGVVVWHDVTPSGKRLVGPAHPLQGALKERSLTLQGGTIKIMDFSPDGRRLVGVSAAASTRPVQVWDLWTGRPRVLPKRVAHLSEVWFGPDGNTLVAKHSPRIAGKNSLVAIDIAAGTMRQLASDVDHTGNGVSGDGSVVVVCREKQPDPDTIGEAHYQAIRVSDGQVLGRHVRGRDTSCREVAVNEKGDHFAVLAMTDEWNLVDTRRDGKARRFLGPSSDKKIDHLPLLGTARKPVIVTRDDHAVTGWPLLEYDGSIAYSPPQLLGDGSRMVVRVGRDGRILRVMETEGEERTLAEVRSDAETPPDAKQPIQVNGSETLVADVSDRNHVTVRELSSLRRVAEFTAAQLPPNEGAKPQEGLDLTQPELLEFRFLGDDRLVTVSGTLVEHWDARAGRRLSQPVDLRDLRLTTKDRPSYIVGRHPEPGHLKVTVHGEPDVHAINLSTGKENKDLRLRLGDDLATAVFLKDSRYAAVMTTGGMVELWSIRPGQPTRRVAGPLGPLNPNRWAANNPGDAGFFLANNSSVRFLKADDPGYRETYEFGEKQGFLAATKDGKALLRSPVSGGRVSLVRLDPALWKRHLCAVLGRDLTDVERSSLSEGLPSEICPS
ncbi:trypsin-like peptidase domain-containing protein [Streptomyces sp. HNM0663]|uniref:Trypsin-like peptidase domain-containing protein n=1 Tax=Streptomyces chengmaiensis TaxID=3040919 RepID=A0ABT6HPH7_9ACTN|nr:trypsin-like peptidase domain-containing protein [Streptomyces chengmaiensis]MDH2390627.1 trypsin-like peptidase domain-containing protein [Streptomyces chengmaiensis]